VTNDDCLACHDDATATRADGTSIAVGAAAYGDSVHGVLSCTDCHADLANAEFPHAEKLAPPDCSACHADAVAGYGKGVHARARAAGMEAAARCTDCHGMHDIRGAKDPGSRTFVLNIPKTCGACHGTADIIKTASAAEGDVYAAYVESVHGKGLVKSGLLVSAECTDCHGAHDIRPKTDPESMISREKLPKTCGACHFGIETVFESSVHGKAVAAGNLAAPTCEDCHTAHRIRRADAEEWKLDVLSECGTCHEQSMTTYRDTFHGKVSTLGFTRVATCAGCHGAHDVLPKADPASRVSAERRRETCRQCHPGVNDNFAAYDPHADKHDRERSPQMYWTARFMQLLLFGTLAFFTMHTVLWFTREVRRGGQHPPSTGTGVKKG
jgi:DnaJ-class molecular chaperone